MGTEIRHAALTPSFLVLGPPRTGSSWIYEVLRKRAVLPSPTKETRFFDVHYDRGWEWYRRHFRPATDAAVIGEVAPTYFASPEARRRIRQDLPNIALLIVLRHPLERLLSLYRLKRAYGIYSWDLEQALERDPELLSSSRYREHVKAWQREFPASQLSIHRFEDLSERPQQFMDAAANHLGVSRFVLAPEELERVHSAGSLSKPRNYYATRGALLLADWCKARELDRLVAAAKQSPLKNLFLGGNSRFPATSPQTLAKVQAALLPEMDFAESIFGSALPAWREIPSDARPAT
jgi:hypothetical protein